MEAFSHILNGVSSQEFVADVHLCGNNPMPGQMLHTWHEAASECYDEDAGKSPRHAFKNLSSVIFMPAKRAPSHHCLIH